MCSQIFSDALNKNADTHRNHYWYKLPKNRHKYTIKFFGWSKWRWSYWPAFRTFLDRKHCFECSFGFFGVTGTIIPKNMFKQLQCIWNFLSFDKHCETTCQSTKSHLWSHFWVLLLWNPPKGTTVTVVYLQKQFDWIKFSILPSRWNLNKYKTWFDKKQHLLGRFMNDVMKWTTNSEITNMCVIKLEDYESLINIRKIKDFDANNHDGTYLVTAWPLHFLFPFARPDWWKITVGTFVRIDFKIRLQNFGLYIIFRNTWLGN